MTGTVSEGSSDSVLVKAMCSFMNMRKSEPEPAQRRDGEYRGRGMEQPVLPLGHAGSDCRRPSGAWGHPCGCRYERCETARGARPPTLRRGHVRQIFIDHKKCKGRVQKKSKIFLLGSEPHSGGGKMALTNGGSIHCDQKGMMP